MPERTQSQRALIHRLNGQLLQALDRQLRLVLGSDWKLEDWIINVLMLNRAIEQTYVARIESSATYYKGKLFKSWKDCDADAGVGGLDFEVPLDLSFTGYCIQTGDVVWLENIAEVLEDSQNPLRDLYRRFDHVAVLPDRDSPTGEYVFPIFVQIGLMNAVLGALNMEFFAEGTPFAKYGQLKVTHLIARLLRAHGPLLLVVDIPEMSTLVSEELVAGEEPATEEFEPAQLHPDAQLLAVHRRVLEKCFDNLQEEEQKR